MKKRIAALAMASCLLLGLTACGETAPQTSGQGSGGQEAEEPLTYADTIAWDGEYDVIVVGFGGAGAVASRYAADAGASVLLVDKAPEGQEGGNTRYCGQFAVYSGDYDQAMAYYSRLYGDLDMDEAVLEAYVTGVTQTKDVLVNDYGVPEDQITGWREDSFIGTRFAPEFPEFEGSEAIDMISTSPENPASGLWHLLRDTVLARPDEIDVWYESPGRHLIQDPVSKAIIGVQIEKQGQMVNIRARNGVILTTGGFENNPQMVQDYLGLTKYVASGSLYNTGDGIKMAMEVGADLWHMNVYEGNNALFGGMSFPVEEGEHAQSSWANDVLGSGSAVLVGDGGERYLREDETARHGHIYFNGEWVNPQRPHESFLIYDQANADRYAEAGAIPERFAEKVVRADTLEELAEKLGIDSEALLGTIEDFNSFAANGYDPAFGRPAQTMTAFSAEGPYYALEFVTDILNTQGGPRRSENAEVLDVNGNPIPHLYSAGEMGGAIAHMYQGGGNIGECVTFGKIAGTNAAAPKDPLPALPGQAESNLVYTIDGDYERNPAEQEFVLEENQYLGVGSGGMGGDVKVIVTMDGDRITSIQVVEEQETPGIGTMAFEQIPDAIIAGQSADVENVAGATLTSEALKAAVRDALSQVQ